MDLRCTACSRHPLMAKLHRDESGQPYVHVKIYKQGRVYGEVVVTKGSEIWLRCRECNRWHCIKMESTDTPMTEANLPEGYEKIS